MAVQGSFWMEQRSSTRARALAGSRGVGGAGGGSCNPRERDFQRGSPGERFVSGVCSRTFSGGRSLGAGLVRDAGSMRRRLSVDLSGSISTDPNLPPRALGHANVHVELSKEQQQERRIKEIRKELAERKPNLEAIGRLLNDRNPKNQAELSKEQQQERKTKELRRTLAEKKPMLEAIDRLPNDRKQKNQAEEGTQAAKDEQKNQAEEGTQAAKDEEYKKLD